jgi:High potential iron-sulfur protein
MSRPTLLEAQVSRREFARNLAIAAGTVVLLPVREPRAAAAPSQPAHLDVKDPAAVALGYTEDASKVNIKKYPSYVKGSTCENCSQLQGTAGAAYRPCGLFPGKVVAVAGWCSGWAVEL